MGSTVEDFEDVRHSYFKYMRIDQALVTRGFCESRQEAQECIELGYVLVDGLVVTKQSKQVREESSITVTQRRTFVSRGGDKLEGALKHIYGETGSVTSALKGKIALDIGSSTGGFTDCLLTYNVAQVTAIDVGTSQLHTKLRNDTRVTVLENTDIRNFNTDHPFDIIVADLSFISLEKILDTILSFGKKDSIFFLLLKPQFEVGKGNTKKGIVKDSTLVKEITERYQALLQEKDVKDIEAFPCSITGGDGNQEYFLYFKV